MLNVSCAEKSHNETGSDCIDRFLEAQHTCMLVALSSHTSHSQAHSS